MIPNKRKTLTTACMSLLPLMSITAEAERIIPPVTTTSEVKLSQEQVPLTLLPDAPDKVTSKKLETLKQENTRLSQQQSNQVEQHKLEMLKLQQEKDRLVLENELQVERNRQELARLIAEKDRILLENELEAAHQTKKLAELTAEKSRLELENAIAEQKQLQILSKIELERSRLAAINALQEERNKEYGLSIQQETARIGFEMTKMEFEKVKRMTNVTLLEEKIAARERQQTWESQVNKPIEYLVEPLVDNHLIISDRRIYLNGPIIPGTASYITERLHFYNNKSEKYPIFLVIDRCAGGSIVEGAKIISAMKSSPAPVHVVVKSLAASMAAVITTLAERSYAYPDALIVHHQIWGASVGNATQQSESLKTMRDWSERLIKPVAEKMGLTMDELITQMYANNSDGNWYEFANKAAELKWVDMVVEDVREMSYTSLPAEVIQQNESLFMSMPSANYAQLAKLPPLNPMDFYFLYNPNGFYHY